MFALFAPPQTNSLGAQHMKVRIYTTDGSSDEPDVQNVEIRELRDYIDFLNVHSIRGADGEIYKVVDVIYDSFQHAVDIMCELSD